MIDDHSPQAPDRSSHPSPPGGGAGQRGGVNRPGIVERYERDVLPALQDRLPDAFPEFGWRRDAGGWRASDEEFTHRCLGVRADRVVSHGDAPRGFLVHGQGPVLWTTFVNGWTPARGRDFVDAVQAIAQRAGMEIDVDSGPDGQGQRERLIADTFAIARHEFQSDAGERAREYLVEERGFPREALASIALGLMPPAEHLRAALVARGHDPERIATARVLSDPRWTGRLVGAWNDERGRPRTMWARAIDSSEPEAPRYLYLAGARRPETRYGLDAVLTGGTELRRSLVLVEGVLDLHHLRARGFDRVAALGGTATAPKLFERLSALGVQTVTLAFDADTAGELATIAAIEAACQSRASPALEVVRLSAAKDPDALIRAVGVDGWNVALRAAEPGIPWRVRRILEADGASADPAERRAVVHRAGAWLGSLDPRDAIDQDAGIQTVASWAKLDIEATRRTFRSRYWSQAITAGPDLARVIGM